MKVLLFIVLKVLEVAAMIAAYLGMSYVGFYVDSLCYTPEEFGWYNPFYFILTLGVMIIIVAVISLLYLLFRYGIPEWIKLNKKWVDKLIK
ncbi:hypothetical protein KAR91_25670 [Candidatus Pacearchaeota archaeon]|nr:hypothetical protein [Candidatus Pacearchaeota archaeon]